MKNPFLFDTDLHPSQTKAMNHFVLKWYILIGSVAFILGYLTGKA